MKCSVHADKTVIMVCRAQQCESCFVCVLCIAGSHNGHKMATIGEVGRMAKKRLQDTFTANDKYLDDQKRKIEIINGMQLADDMKQKELRQLMETQGQRMHETVDKVIAHMISHYDFKYERRLKELDCTKHLIREDITRVQSSQDSLEQTLETDDWLQIVEDEKKLTTTRKVEDLPEDITLGVTAEEVNNNLVEGILSAL
ncbi:uncharacterized protein LOC110442705 [Mizuhopecten yessoensis]|nr:uncharacterized protein LOC110442705 [Mizuhopecten yessoensis]